MNFQEVPLWQQRRETELHQGASSMTLIWSLKTKETSTDPGCNCTRGPPSNILWQQGK